MIIDFHTHTFPDNIAEKAMAHLSDIGGINPYRDGTVTSLIKSMKHSGIDACVVLPVATAPRQVDTINKISVKLNGIDGLFFFGAVHPDCDNVEEILDGIKESGLVGIKIHPDYQGVYFNDERYIKILRLASERDLITVTHSGFDAAYPDDIHCTPEMIEEVICRLEGIIDDKLVLAHMGGALFGNADIERLIGKPVYLDTAYVLNIDPDKCADIIKRHGSDHVLFATDSPWADQNEFVDLMKCLTLKEEEKNDVLYKNAERLLRLR